MNDHALENRINKNSRLIALYLLQFSILIPVMHFVNPTILVALGSCAIMMGLILSNRALRINPIPIILLVFITLLFLLKLCSSQTDASAIIYFLLFTLPVVFISQFPFRYDVFLDSFTTIGKRCFLLLFWIPFTPLYSYMRFGYGILPVIMAAYLDFLYSPCQAHTKSTYRRHLVDMIIFVAGTLELVAYGARGATFSLLLFFALDRLLVNKKSLFTNLSLIAVTAIIALNIVKILEFAERVAKSIGVYSYSITKFRMQLAGGFAYAASGRMKIYNRAIEAIKEHPWTGGFLSLDESGGHYYHNLFLQVTADLGIIALIVLVFFLIYVLYKLTSSKVQRSEKLVLLLLFSISIGRLMFSSTIWRRPEFWMLVFITLSIKVNKKYNQPASVERPLEDQ